MKKLFKTTQEKLLLLVKGSLAGMLVSIGPLALIHHRQTQVFFTNLDWSSKIFFALCIIAGIIFYSGASLLTANNFIFAFTLLYLFCYTACCALCQKLGWTIILTEPNSQISSSSSAIPLPILILGWFLIALAAAIQLAGAVQNARTAHANNDKQDIVLTDNTTAYKQSFRLGCTLLLAGISLSFGIWLPLTAIPGVLVAIKWLD